MPETQQTETVSIDDVLLALHYALQLDLSETTRAGDRDHLMRVMDAYIDQRIALALAKPPHLQHGTQRDAGAVGGH